MGGGFLSRAIIGGPAVAGQGENKSALTKFLVDDIEHGPRGGVRAYKYGLTMAVLMAVLLAVTGTIPSLSADTRAYLRALELLAFSLVAGDFVLRIIARLNPASRSALPRYLLSFNGLVDLASVLPLCVALTSPDSRDVITVLSVPLALKIARYSPALAILKDVIVAERKPLISALYVMFLLTIITSTLMYFVERQANPAGFQSVPHAMWWSVVTLATLGYGDVVPLTTLGKILGGLAAIMGFGMFALPAGILATGFSQEIKRIRSVASWNLVAKVPLFSVLEAGAISEIAQLLRVRRFSKNETIARKGDRGDAMYFILEGTVEAYGDGWQSEMRAGDFFGEIALIKNVARTASVRAKTRTECLELSSYNLKQLELKNPEILERIAERGGERHARG